MNRAAELLAGSATGDISTRAVCEAAGVGQPVLYRIFGDKEGLLSAVVDQVWDEYLTMKRRAVASADPLDDLRSGWDNHTAFALAHPHAYRLLFGTSLTTVPEAAAEAMRLLTEVLERLAEQGRLRMPPQEAGRIVMAANSGLALALILRPQANPDLSISPLMRDSVIRSILTDTEPVPSGASGVAAITLRAYLPHTEIFTLRERGLLDEWLERIQTEHDIS